MDHVESNVQRLHRLSLMTRSNVWITLDEVLARVRDRFGVVPNNPVCTQEHLEIMPNWAGDVAERRFAR